MQYNTKIKGELLTTHRLKDSNFYRNLQIECFWKII